MCTHDSSTKLVPPPVKLSALTYHQDSSFYFDRINRLESCVWLDSGRPHSTAGRYDILSALPSSELTEADPDTMVQKLAHRLHQHPCDSTLPFAGGWLGFLGYQYRHGHFKLPKKKSYSGGDAWFGWYDWGLVQDHLKQEAFLFFRDSCSEETRAQVEDSLATTPIDDHFNCSTFAASQTEQEYLAAVTRIQDYILAGDCYQTNYSQRLSAHFEGSSASAYAVLRQAVPSPFSAYLALPSSNTAILSISPERFLQIDGRQVIAQPIKGTIPRGSTADEDQALSDSLKNSPKNRAENLMIVDLLRNDLGQHCEPGSVRVPKLFDLHSFANVHHLISTVTGTLPTHVNHPEFLLACFPGGSITGAPKKRAMEIIEELEEHPRGIYCGAIGYFSCNDRSDFNIAIRTLLRDGKQIHCWGGGGIVTDSEPHQELKESQQKVKLLMDALQDP